MASTYASRRRSMFRNLADHCHDKAIETNVPETAARWMLLVDHCLWAADAEGDADGIERFLKGPSAERLAA